MEPHIRPPDCNPTHPIQNNDLKRHSDEKITGSPYVTAHGDVVDRSVDVCLKKTIRAISSNPSSESPGLWHEETDSD